MNFWDRVTGADMTREMNLLEARAGELPPEFQAAWAEIVEKLWPHSDLTGRNLMPIFGGVLGLLEESAAEGQSVDEVLDGDIESFCAALAGGEGARSVRDKWRDQLNRNVAKKLGK